ncbi:MAG: PrsW family intramembrane metalloprotease [Butyrivibrio sp.]|uniref:PrsW family glutamic-type intramembrane protease n=1 Tax=Butyrivibrio sp. TaxID=28121 RepID=UPI0025D9AAAB|nr:PrsW family glutamic-type intramembrane protease [Butyrivibrio sp.]MCR5770908.1 PrsW family intramembrane metalloprotease [Butyrivibrio sp.]
MILVVGAIQVIAVSFMIAWLIRHKCGEKFSRLYIAELIGLGFLALALAAVLGIVFWEDGFIQIDNPFLKGMITALLSAALIEEISKYSMFRIAALNKKQVVTRLDAVIASSVVALGFTIGEDILYSLEGGLGTLIRVFLPCHLLFGAVMGYYYGKAKNTNKWTYHVLSLVGPIVLHTIFDGIPFALSIIFDRLDLMTTSETATNMDPVYLGIIICTLGILTTFIIFFVLVIMTFRQVSKCSKNNLLNEEINIDYKLMLLKKMVN